MTREEIAGAARTEGGMFAVIPAVVLRDGELSMSARMLYGILTWRCNSESRCWPSNRELGEELGLSPKRVSALLSLLEERGHIETEVVRDKDTGQILRRYIYPIVKSGRGGIPENEDTPPQNQGDPSPEMGGPHPENEEYIGKKKKEKINSNNPLPPEKKSGRKAKPQELDPEVRRMLNRYVAHDPELTEAMQGLMDIRQSPKSKAVNTPRAIRILLNRLDQLSGGQREIKIQILQQSVAATWDGIFPLRGSGGRLPPPERREVIPIE